MGCLLWLSGFVLHRILWKPVRRPSQIKRVLPWSWLVMVLTLHLTCWFKQKCSPNHWNLRDFLETIRSEMGERLAIIRNKSTERGAKSLGQVPPPRGTLWAGCSLTIPTRSQGQWWWHCLRIASGSLCADLEPLWVQGWPPFIIAVKLEEVTNTYQVYEHHGHYLGGKRAHPFAGWRTYVWYSREVISAACSLFPFLSRACVCLNPYGITFQLRWGVYFF